MSSYERQPYTVKRGGSYRDSKGVTHIVGPGDVIPADAVSSCADNYITSSSTIPPTMNQRDSARGWLAHKTTEGMKS